jgi:hypothetical protein
MERTNLLHEFFNSKSDANEILEASNQENLENKFQQFMTEEGEKHGLDFVNEMCLESLTPELSVKWEEIKNELKDKRMTLKRHGYTN